jgi:hypothetical protein
MTVLNHEAGSASLVIKLGAPTSLDQVGQSDWSVGGLGTGTHSKGWQ